MVADSPVPSLAPKVKVLGVEAFEQPFRLRMPFRFGAVTHTEGRQAIVRAHVRLDDGREGFGYAAEALAAKWFDKNPALSDAQNHDQLRKSIEIAADAYREAPPSTPFDLFADNYRYQLRAGRGVELPPLVASYGNALLDRAVLDAVCRMFGVSFWTAMRSNLAGMTPHPVIPDLAGFDFGAFLAGLVPVTSIEARHTVGLVDPITAADQAPGTRVDDGLPETLEEVVAAYGQRCFKLKVSGERSADVDRLVRIAGVLDRVENLHVTLDGNEQYDDVESVVDLWSAMEAEPRLQQLCAATLFIEQPIKRQVALARSVSALARLRPVIIDESDGELDAFPRARSLGYGGVSSKDCKGFYKSIVNLARCRLWNAEGDDANYFLSGEDLTTQAGLSVQQDLALVSLLGLSDVERNGHHFIDGFAGRPQGEALAFLEAHPDLYFEENRSVRLRIENGRLALGSLDCPGFGSAVVPDLSTTAPMPKADWPPQP
jgi:hypothetical protein